MKNTQTESVLEHFGNTYGIALHDCLRGKIVRRFAGGAGSMVDIGIDLDAYLPVTLPIGADILVTVSDLYISKYGDTVKVKLDSVRVA